jgi:hypothetical protein
MNEFNKLMKRIKATKLHKENGYIIKLVSMSLCLLKHELLRFPPQFKEMEGGAT